MTEFLRHKSEIFIKKEKAIEFLLDRMKDSKTNDDFFDQMKRKSSN